MSYQTNADDIRLRLKGLGYAESSEVDNFDDAGKSEYGNTFILKLITGELLGADDTLLNRYRDAQNWEIQIAFDRSKHSDITNLDILQRSREDIIKDLDNTSNYGTGVFKRRYNNFSLTVNENYYVLTINLEVTDQVTY